MMVLEKRESRGSRVPLWEPDHICSFSLLSPGIEPGTE